VQVTARVRSSSELLPRTRLLWLEAPDISGPARPGQFVMVRCGEGPDPLLRRPFSIHGTDDPGGVALLFETVGKGTAWLAERTPGDPVDLIGPLGNGFRIGPDCREILLVAGGIGIAPLAFLAEAAARMGKRVSLLQGARTASLLCPRHRLPPDAAVVPITDDGSGGRKGVVTGLLAEYAARADQVFACGPPAMYRAMADLECLKGKPVQLSLEERMACGLGACFGCTVRTRGGPRQVCHDGPVFEMADVFW
jgi:dihydroorotate dehydrogenase electron transfer subunit